jgi:hypothetical protein
LQLKILTKAMIADLSHFQPDEINQAFTRWRQESEKIPTPAAIIKLIHASKPEPEYLPPEGRGAKSYDELSEKGKKLFDEAMKMAKYYLKKGIVLHKPANAVQWYGKFWEHWTSDDVRALKQHCVELERSKGREAVEEYIKFLNYYCNVPRSVLN